MNTTIVTMAKKKTSPQHRSIVRKGHRPHDHALPSKKKERIREAEAAAAAAAAAKAHLVSITLYRKKEGGNFTKRGGDQKKTSRSASLF